MREGSATGSSCAPALLAHEPFDLEYPLIFAMSVTDGMLDGVLGRILGES